MRCIEPFASTATASWSARVRVPGSKSLSNRHLVLAALAHGESELRGVLHCADCDALVAALTQLGAQFETQGDVMRVKGVAGSPRATARIDLGDGGTPTRFMLAVAALAHDETVIDGSARMRQRPIDEGVDMLGSLGANARFCGDARALPVAMRGPLEGGAITLGVTASSQFISALMLVAPCTKHGIVITLDEVATSESYLHLSLAALAAAGVNAEVAYRPTLLSARNCGSGLARVSIAAQPMHGARIDIEPDASSAVYPAALALLLRGRIEIDGLALRSAQPDSWFFDDIALRGALVQQITRDDGSIATVVQWREELHALDAHYQRAPDSAVMAMVLAATASHASTFTGLSTLRVKESDRIESVAAGLRALGGVVETGSDWVRVHPLPATLTPACIDTANDHRIAMAFAILGCARAGVTLMNPEVVSKSWPEFFEVLDLLAREISRQIAAT